MPRETILVTGASSGFGLMAARALAEAGHTVHASMRETGGRNAPRAAELAAWSAERGLDLRPLAACRIYRTDLAWVESEGA